MADIAKLLEGYQNKFTLDNRLRPLPNVTKEKVLFIKGLYEKAQAGSWMAEAQLKELFTTSDAGFSLAHLLNIQTIPQLPEVIEELDGLMGKRTVKDFNPVALREDLFAKGVDGAGVDEYGAAAIVPEGTSYPIVTFTGGEDAYYQKLAKRGLSFAWTFEAWINDLIGELEAIPERLLTVYRKTLIADYWEAMNQAAQTTESVTLPNSVVIPAQPALSAAGIVATAVAIENREINGNKIGELPSYIVLVPRGQKRFLEYDIARWGRVLEVQDGTITLAPDRELQALFPSIRIVETDRLSGTNWKMYPTPGTTPRPVIERLTLRGYETPELRYRNDQGQLPGGGKVGIFEGGFVADTSELRLRIITGAALWDDTWIGVSNGTGAIPDLDQVVA